MKKWSSIVCVGGWHYHMIKSGRATRYSACLLPVGGPLKCGVTVFPENLTPLPHSLVMVITLKRTPPYRFFPWKLPPPHPIALPNTWMIHNYSSLLLLETYANESSHFRLQDLTKISPSVRNSTPIIAYICLRLHMVSPLHLDGSLFAFILCFFTEKRFYVAVFAFNVTARTPRPVLCGKIHAEL